MTSQGDSKPPEISDMPSSAPASGGSGKVCSESHSGEETHDISRAALKRFLTHREAEAGCPADCSACGEEDPGVALELLVEDSQARRNSL